MEYDPAFPTEDNDEEIDHIIDVTEIPLPVSKKKSKRQSKLMKIPLPDEKSNEITKPVVETSNSPPQEPDTSWLLPTSTQGPLKFNIIKTNTIKPTDEESSIFDDLDMKMEPLKPVKLLPKKSKPMTLPTGVIVKNAEFVVNEPKTNIELFLPPKITATDSSSSSSGLISNINIESGSNLNIISSINNPNMSYIIPQKLRSAQMISQPLIANPAVASLSQKKSQESNSKSENRKKSRSSSRDRKSSKSPKIKTTDNISLKDDDNTDGIIVFKNVDEQQSDETKIKDTVVDISLNNPSRSRSVSPKHDTVEKPPKTVEVSEIRRKSRSKTTSESPNREKVDFPEKWNTKKRRSSSYRSKSVDKSERNSNTKNLKQNSNKSSRGNQRQESINKTRGSPSRNKRQRSNSRNNKNRSPYYQNHRKRSDSRNRRSQSPHRGLGNRYRGSPNQNIHRNSNGRSPRSRSRNRKSFSPDSRQVWNQRSRSRKRSNSRRKTQNYRSNSRNRDSNAWKCDSNDDGRNNRKKSTDCWAVESETEDRLTPQNSSEICDKKSGYTSVSEMEKSSNNNETTDLIDDKIIVSSSNSLQGSLKIDKNEDATVSSTVDETKPGYSSDNQNDSELVEVDSDSKINSNIIFARQDEEKPQNRSRKSRSLTPNVSVGKNRSYSAESDRNSKWEQSRQSRVSSRSPQQRSKSRNNRRSKSRSMRPNQFPRDTYDQSNRNKYPRYSRSPNRNRKPSRNAYDDHSQVYYKPNYTDSRPYRDRRSRSNSSNFKYSAGKSRGNQRKRFSSSGSEHGVNPYKNKNPGRDYRYTKKRDRSFSSHSENENRFVKCKETRRGDRKTNRESITSEENWDNRNKKEQFKSKKNEENKYKRKDRKNNNSPDSVQKVKSKTRNKSSSRQRKRSNSHDSHYNRLKKDNTKYEKNNAYKNTRERSCSDFVENEQEQSNYKKSKHKREYSNSNDSNSISRSPSVEKKNVKRSKKTEKVKKSKVKKRKKSSSCSINSDKVPASYQGIRKTKKNDKLITSGSESSSSYIRKEKSKKVRKI